MAVAFLFFETVRQEIVDDLDKLVAKGRNVDDNLCLGT